MLLSVTWMATVVERTCYLHHSDADCGYRSEPALTRPGEIMLGVPKARISSALAATTDPQMRTRWALVKVERIVVGDGEKAAGTVVC
jgi:hypothetical protein